MFNIGDRNDSGTISFEEFLALFDVFDEEAERMKTPLSRHSQSIGLVFRADLPSSRPTKYLTWRGGHSRSKRAVPRTSVCRARSCSSAARLVLAKAR